MIPMFICVYDEMIYPVDPYLFTNLLSFLELQLAVFKES